MPEKDHQNDTAASKVIIGWSALGVLALVIGALLVWPYLNMRTTKTTNLALIPVSTTTASLKDSSRSGNYEKALKEYDAVMKAPISSDERALAILTGSTLNYRTTDDTQFLLTHIPLIKSVIEDSSVSLQVHVAAINALASSYCASGRTWKVFEEIYKGAPYSTFLVPNDPDMSSKKMFTWSYQQMPSADAAISLAKIYAGAVVSDEFQGNKEAMAEDLKQAKYYLEKADVLAPSERLLEGPDYDRSARYAVFLYWRAYTVAILAHYEGEPYKSEYKKAYEDFLSRYENERGIQDLYTPLAHMLYGYFLRINASTPGANDAAAIAQFEAIIPFVKSDPYFDTNRFVRLIRNERDLRVNRQIYQGSFSLAIREGRTVSPKFNTFAQEILAADASVR